MELQGLDIDVVRKGSGQPLLLLHGGGGPIAQMPFADRLAEKFEIIAPTHPGFNGKKSRSISPASMTWFISI